MFVDPAVSRAKFQREVEQFKAQLDAHHRRGIWLVDDRFPEVFIVLMSTRALPITAVFGVVINFDNYDVEPPSVQFVHPVTRQPLKAGELPHGMPRLKRVIGPGGVPETGPGGEAVFEPQQLIQFEDPQRPAFVCLRGVREYHDHPAHTGDSWWLHRGTGVGTLAYLVNILATYGIDIVQGIKLQVQLAGFNVIPRPE